MGTKITKGNAESAIKDDKAHIDYLKEDVLDDQHTGGKYKDIDQTADEKHISHLAGDIKADGHFLSKHWSHNKSFSNPSPHEGGPEVFDHSWGGESVELQDQGGDSPLHKDDVNPDKKDKYPATGEFTDQGDDQALQYSPLTAKGKIRGEGGIGA